jgi:CBS domain-containing protein
MNACDVMTSQPTTVSLGTTLATALKTMLDVGCHHLPVLSAEQHLMGILSIHDCQQALGEPLRKNPSLPNLALANVLLVSRVMTPAPTKRRA